MQAKTPGFFCPASQMELVRRGDQGSAVVQLRIPEAQTIYPRLYPLATGKGSRSRPGAPVQGHDDLDRRHGRDFAQLREWPATHPQNKRRWLLRSSAER